MERQLRCPRCLKRYIFLGVGIPTLCPECIIMEKEDYAKVREYIRENPGVDMYKVFEETQVPVKKIMRYIREELIEVAPGSHSFLQCDACGKIINTGAMCEDCRKRYGEQGVKGTVNLNLNGTMHVKRKDNKLL